jgi:hypothetical protein
MAAQKERDWLLTMYPSTPLFVNQRNMHRAIYSAYLFSGGVIVRACRPPSVCRQATPIGAHTSSILFELKRLSLGLYMVADDSVTVSGGNLIPIYRKSQNRANSESTEEKKGREGG